MKKIFFLITFVLFGFLTYASPISTASTTKTIELTENMVLGHNDISDKIIYLGTYDVYVNGEYIGTYDVYLVTP